MIANFEDWSPKIRVPKRCVEIETNEAYFRPPGEWTPDTLCEAMGDASKSLPYVLRKSIPDTADIVRTGALYKLICDPKLVAPLSLVRGWQFGGIYVRTWPIGIPDRPNSHVQDDLFWYACDIAEALGWIHVYGWLHRDARRANIVRREGRERRWMLVDYEMACKIDADLNVRKNHSLHITHMPTGCLSSTPWEARHDYEQFFDRGLCADYGNDADDDALRDNLPKVLARFIERDGGDLTDWPEAPVGWRDAFVATCLANEAMMKIRRDE